MREKESFPQTKFYVSP